MAQMIAVTRLDLSRVILALKTNAKLYSVLAEIIGDDDSAKKLQSRKQIALGLASDLRAKMCAQGGFQKDSVSETQEVDTERKEVATPATDTDDTLTALNETICNLNIQLSEQQRALTRLVEGILGLQERLKYTFTSLQVSKGATVGAAGFLHQQIPRFDPDANQLHEQENQAVREEMGSLKDTAPRESDLSAIWSKISAMQTELKSIDRVVSGYEPFTDRVEQHSAKELKGSLVALRVEIADMRKNVGC